MSNIDPDVLAGAIRRLRSLDAGTDLEARLGQVVSLVSEVFASDGAGLMFLDDQSALRYATATDEGSRLLEQAQEDTGHGPCVSSLVNDTLVATSDVQTDPRWPTLSALMRGSRVHAVLGIPVRLGGGALGSLNVYRAEPHPWTDDEIDALGSFNQIVETVVATALLAEHHSRLSDQLQTALDTRVVIERAVGFLMARHHLDAVDAFDRLRRAARADQRRVADLAAEVLTGNDLPTR
jgi:GAF domain-containing protein